MELETLKKSNGSGGSKPTATTQPLRNGASIPENSRLLDVEDEGDRNGVEGTHSSARHDENGGVTLQMERAVKRVKKELTTEVVWKLRLWMVLIILILTIFIVAVIAIAINIATYRDPDDRYDGGSFVLSRVFRGSLSINQNFTTNTSSLHQVATQLEGQLNAVYRSSPALGRYFRYTRIKTLRGGSVIIDFCLMFLTPLDSDQLLRYTMSREVVGGVLRQHLYDQVDLSANGSSSSIHISPASLTMQEGGATCT